MAHYRQLGAVPPKRHTRTPGPDGSLLHEELVGADGFSGESALLYHRRSPSAITGVRALADDEVAATHDHPVTPRHLVTDKLPRGGDPVRGRTTLLANPDVRVRWAHADASSPRYRNAVGDELTYIQSGDAVVRTPFGDLEVGAGDYVVVPRSVTQQWFVDGHLAALTVEARGHVRFPDRYVNRAGQFVEGSPYCERDLRSPATLAPTEDGPVDVLVRNRGGWTSMDHAHDPFDVVGWDGALYPFALNVDRLEPVVGAGHQPPPVHQTFAGEGFVVCTFVPRPLDFGPDATKVPYHHSNADSDEVLFYSSGDFSSRRGSGIGVGSISYHPSGFVHGPQPGSVEAAADADRTDEVAVMVDTFAPLAVTDAARSVTDDDYPWTWAR